ncbi:MAG: redoxin domain-containing protein [Proteobacteria bacterium]|nr:redoxin domain-containing protein [Pseudomonadota bacterium]
MFSVRSIIPTALLLVSLVLAGCDGMTDDLRPSGDDKRPTVEAGTIGTQVGQQSPEFPVQVLDTLGVSRGLYNELAGSSGVVLYFTMWCPICEFDMSHMRKYVIPNFPTVKFFLVDYVSGSVSVSRASQEAYGYTDIDTLVDPYIDQVNNSGTKVLENMYQATMGSTIVIDSTGIVQMNETYKDGVKLTETLQALP